MKIDKVHRTVTYEYTCTLVGSNAKGNIKYKNIKVMKPEIVENFTKWKLYPMECWLWEMTYSGIIYVDIELIYAKKLPILESDTKNIIEYIEQKNLKKKKYNFWKLLETNE